jgi:NTE family protein
MKKLSLLVLLSLSIPAVHAQTDTKNPEKRRPSVGLVLSGGGAKGFAYVGLLKAIQKAGLPIDYIGGSSIGSIVGGLYALGYHPDSIAKIIRTQNWNDLLKDIIDRKYIAYEEKEFGEKTIVKLPIRNKRVGISSAMYKGQEINLLLNYYFSPAFKVHDFHELPVPFLCMGTDLFTGKEVELDSGYLPMAIRASMSIPGYFTPTDYNGYYLVDGGVVNNYPVKNVKAMGAEIIVGGDVQSGLYTTREELNSITAILDQITSFPRVEANRIGDSLTDLKVKFPPEYGMMDFEMYDSIIALGEQTAEAAYPRIKALADSLNAIAYKPLRSFTTMPLDTLYIDSIKINGNKRVPDSYFNSLLRGKDHSKISLKQLEEDIRYLNGTGFFESVGYTLEDNGQGANLVIEIQESGIGHLSAGVHFDNDYSVSLILSGAFRNLFGPNSKLFADLNLGPNPRLRVVYMQGLSRKTSICLSSDFYQFKFNQYDGDVKTTKVSYTNYKGSLFFNFNIRNTVNFKTGFDYEYFRFKEDYPYDSLPDVYQDFSGYGTFFGSLGADTRDRPYYPTRGFNAGLRMEYIMPFGKSTGADLFSNAAVIFMKYDHNIPLYRRFTLQPGLFAGALLSNSMSPPPQHIFALGGLSPRNYIEQYVPFTGVKFLQEFGYYSVVARLKLQYNVYQKLYLTLRADGGTNVLDEEDLFSSSSYIFGYGLTGGYDSFIGPVELTLMASNVNPKPMLFLNIGFCF